MRWTRQVQGNKYIVVAVGLDGYIDAEPIKSQKAKVTKAYQSSSSGKTLEQSAPIGTSSTTKHMKS
eukprot:CCRYP_009146-RA/>CCRYP_009146-RA protein AED:0.47 eAED:0.47 QI:0/0/0/1/0/0/2/0/65